MASRKSIGSGLGFITVVLSRIISALKESGEDILDALSQEKIVELADQFAAALVAAGRAAKNIFSINVGGNRNTDEVVRAGKYDGSNSWINSRNFPWRRRIGKRTIQLVDMAEHGFTSTYTINDALAVLNKLGLDHPVYEDGLLFGEQHPEKQRERAIMFPHAPLAGAIGDLRVVYLWSDAGRRGLGLRWPRRPWSVRTLVAGVRR